MTIGICDDDIFDCEKIQDICRLVMNKNIDNYEIIVFGDGYEIFEKQNTLDILILDIEMPQMSGIEVKQRLQLLGQKTMIIFVSSHEEQILSAFGINVYGFVIKRFMDTQLAVLLENAVNTICQTVMIDENIDSRLVKYIKSDKIYCEIFLRSGERVLMRKHICEYEADLEKAGFIRTHKSYLVNLQYVNKISNNTALIGCEEIPVSIRMKKNVIKKYQEFCEKNARYC